MTSAQQAHRSTDNMPFYADAHAHLADELRKLDLVIRLQVMALRQEQAARSGLAVDPRIAITHEEVDCLLDPAGPIMDEQAEPTALRQQIQAFQHEINAKIQASLDRGVFLTLPHLAHLFGLSPFEVQTLIICLAPELQRKYDQLYAYLQDDITRKKPSVDLVLALLCASHRERWRARPLFSDQARLLRTGIVHLREDPESPSGSSGLAQFLALDPRILNYILGENSVDGRLQSFARLMRPAHALDDVLVEPTLKESLRNLVHHHFDVESASGEKVTLYFHGPYGVGKRELALGLCAQLNCPLLYVDAPVLLLQEPEWVALLRRLFREALLLQAAFYLDHVDRLLDEGGQGQAFIKALTAVADEYGWLTFLAGERAWPLQGTFARSVFQTIELAVPDVALRQAAWKQVWASSLPGMELEWARQLAGQFRLTPGQIRDAAKAVNNRQVMGQGREALTLADLYAACRSQSNQNLGELAVKIDARYGWEDIVLPPDKLTQLQEICSQVKHRYRVLGEWGFDRKLSHGKGFSALFFGPPGTGKTLAAQVIARELQLDLYKIDLSGVVSKYIGETEKNLSRIFHEAETSNAILFFDEADALFGKRTEVSDAHDRYANIETSYLLQKMEEYEGVVILSTNLRENMDDAFTRRIRFIVEFPFPDAASRMAIWKTHFPVEAPVSDGIDYEFLADRFQIAGGNIKNIVLSAAFFAAENGGVIGMDQILHGTRREFEKMGKLWNEQRFTRSGP